MTNLITIRRYNGTGFTVALPKTVVEQVATVKEHVENNDIHVSTADRALLVKTVTLDADGKVPVAKLGDRKQNVILDFESVEAFTTALPTIPAGRTCFVVTGEHSWAMYQTKGEGQYVEIANTLSAEVQSGSWETLQNKPASSVTSIDQMVEQDHTHANLAVLDKLKENSFAAKKSLALTKTIKDGQIPPNTDGLGVGSMLFVVNDPKVNPELNLDTNSLTSVLLKLKDGTHTESIRSTVDVATETVKYIKSIKFTNNSTNCEGTVRHSMTKQNDEVLHTDYLLEPGETRLVTIDIPKLYKEHDFKIIDINPVGEVDPKKYGVEVDILAEEVVENKEGHILETRSVSLTEDPTAGGVEPTTIPVTPVTGDDRSAVSDDEGTITYNPEDIAAVGGGAIQLNPDGSVTPITE